MTVNQDKLAKVCQMLGSSHLGERAAAAQLATSMLREAGLSWEDLIQKAFEVRPPQSDPKAGGSYTTWSTKKEDPEVKYGVGKRWVYDGYDVDKVVDDILADVMGLSEKDHDFVESVRGQLDRLGEGCSPKQWVWLKRIARKEGLIP